MTSQGGADGEDNGGGAKETFEEEDKSEHVFIAVGRVFSGTIRKGDSLKALRKVFKVRGSAWILGAELRLEKSQEP